VLAREKRASWLAECGERRISPLKSYPPWVEKLEDAQEGDEVGFLGVGQAYGKSNVVKIDNLL